MNRHKQRENTFRLLFSLGVSSKDQEIEDIDVCVKSLELAHVEDEETIKERTTELIQHIDTIDGYIEECSKRWAIDRIAKIELAILRVAVFDMLYDQVPVSVAINEAVELSKLYGEEQSSKFVNGVLGQVAKKI